MCTTLASAVDSAGAWASASRRAWKSRLSPTSASRSWSGPGAPTASIAPPRIASRRAARARSDARPVPDSATRVITTSDVVRNVESPRRRDKSILAVHGLLTGVHDAAIVYTDEGDAVGALLSHPGNRRQGLRALLDATDRTGPVLAPGAYD